MNVAQFKINDRFKLSLSDLGKDNQGFEPMLIDTKSNNELASLQNDGSRLMFHPLKGTAWSVWNVTDLEIIIKEAKLKANKIIKKELIKANKDLFI